MVENRPNATPSVIGRTVQSHLEEIAEANQPNNRMRLQRTVINYRGDGKVVIETHARIVMSTVCE